MKLPKKKHEQNSRKFVEIFDILMTLLRIGSKANDAKHFFLTFRRVQNDQTVSLQTMNLSRYYISILSPPLYLNLLGKSM